MNQNSNASLTIQQLAVDPLFNTPTSKHHISAMDEVRNQLDYGTCVHFTVGYVASACLSILMGLSCKYPVSIQDILNRLNHPPQEAGMGTPPELVCRFLKYEGACLESEVPYKGTKDLQAVAKPKGPYLRIRDFGTISGSFEVICGYLDKQPLIAELYMTEKFKKLYGTGTYKGTYTGPKRGTKKREICEHSDGTPETHCVAVVGYDRKERVFFIQNTGGVKFAYHGLLKVDEYTLFNFVCVIGPYLYYF